MRLQQHLKEQSVGEDAKKIGLVHIGWGRYVKKDNPDIVVAISKNGKLVFLKTPEQKEQEKSQEEKPQEEESTVEQDFDGGSPSWQKQHTYTTANGSRVIGTPHISEKGAKHYVETILIPQVLDIAEEAIKNGKKVVFMAEGEARGEDWGGDKDEQDMVALALKKKFGKKVIQDSWDDNTSPYAYNEKSGKNSVDRNSEMFKNLVMNDYGLVQAKDNENMVDAALSAMDAGQGTPMNFSKEAKKELKKVGVDYRDEKAMYKLCFPQDFNKPSNQFSKIVDKYNHLRQDRILQKTKEIENKGGITITTPGASHAYELTRK